MSTKCKDKICSQDKICNPKTGRCVLKSGNIGKKLGKKSRSLSRSRSRSKISKKYSEIFKFPVNGIFINIEDFIGKSAAKFLNEYDFFSYIGSGSYGEIIKACKYNGDCRAVKIMIIDGKLVTKDEFIREYEMGKKFHKYGMGPKFYSMKIYNDCKLLSKNEQLGIIKMEKIDGILSNLLYSTTSRNTVELIVENLIYLLNLLCKHNLIHGDFHLNNIGFIFKKLRSDIYPEFKLIDFGWSCCVNIKNSCNPKLEIEQLIRTGYSDGKHMNKDIFIYYIQLLHDTYIENFGGKSVVLKTYKQAMNLCDKFDKIQEKTHNNYIRKKFDPDI